MKRYQMCAAFLVALEFLTTDRAAADDRKVLAELFTSTTCAPCYNADVYYFSSWLPTFTNRSRVITIAYHVWWPSPGNDPMYLANTTDVRARAFFCQGTSLYAPRMFVDGHFDAMQLYNNWPGVISSELTQSSPVGITLAGVRDPIQMKVTISVTATAAVNSQNWRLHCVVVEDGISCPQASSGGSVPFVHECVHRGMFPGSDGTPLSITQGQTVTSDITIAFAPAWNPENCRVVVFVQDFSTKGVQQAEALNVADMTWGIVSVAQNPLPVESRLEQNFPNPFNPSTTIRYSLSAKSRVLLSVFNAIGQHIATLAEGEKERGFHDVRFNGSGLASGVYVYRLEVHSAGHGSGGKDVFIQSRKFALLR